MAAVRLDERRVRTLRPRKSTYDVRDRKLMGFGVRVMPSGAKRYFIHLQYQGRRTWKIVGEAGSIGTDEARDRAKTVMAAIREGNLAQSTALPDCCSASNLDPTVSCKFNELGRRSASNLRADQQSRQRLLAL